MNLLPLTESVRVDLLAFFGEPNPENMAAGWSALPDSAIVTERGKLPAIRLDTPFGVGFDQWRNTRGNHEKETV